MATHSSVLAWRIPGTGEPGGPSMGSQSQTRLKRISSSSKRTQQHLWSHEVGSTFTRVLGETPCVGLNQRRNRLLTVDWNKGPPVRLSSFHGNWDTVCTLEPWLPGPQEMSLSYEVIIKMYAHLSGTEKFWKKREREEKSLSLFATRRINSLFLFSTCSYTIQCIFCGHFPLIVDNVHFDSLIPRLKNP